MHSKMSRVRTVGLVGLGVIGRVHLNVLRAHPRARLTFVADPSLDTHGNPIAPDRQRHYKDLSTALHGVQRGDIAAPDFVVLATPTTTHLHLASEILDQTGSTILSEKPLTGDVDRLHSFERRQPDASDRVHVVNHFAFSPEVAWAADFVEQQGWGFPSFVLSTFNDPYVNKFAAQATYVSSWIDSGPNQLGLLSRFLPECGVRSHTATPEGTRSITEISYPGGRGILSSNWHTGDSSKQTALRWLGGREILLDHTAMTGIAVDADIPVVHFGHGAAVDRKTAHYAAMYDAYLTEPSLPVFSMAFARSIATLLSEATTSAPARTALAWRLAPHTTAGRPHERSSRT